MLKTVDLGSEVCVCVFNVRGNKNDTLNTPQQWEKLALAKFFRIPWTFKTDFVGWVEDPVTAGFYCFFVLFFGASDQSFLFVFFLQCIFLSCLI